MRLLLSALALFAATAAHAQPFDAATIDALRALPAEQVLAGGSLRVVNVYRTEALVLHEMAGQPAEAVVDRLAREVYAPHRTFWDGYIGDEANFREWAAETLLDTTTAIYTQLAPLGRVPLDSLYEDAAAWLFAETGRQPEGTWYLVVGPGWTNMGGMSDGMMVVDFTKMEPDAAAIAAILPHELTHQVHGPALTRAGDPDRGTVLHRIISEGFATYVATVHSHGAMTPAQALWYSPAEWDWGVQHEAELWAAAQPLLSSTSREDIGRVADRQDQLIEGSPTAAGYFLGVRIVQAYVARHGADSWKELFDLPVREVVARSGFGE